MVQFKATTRTTTTKSVKNAICVVFIFSDRFCPPTESHRGPNDLNCKNLQRECVEVQQMKRIQYQRTPLLKNCDFLTGFSSYLDGLFFSQVFVVNMAQPQPLSCLFSFFSTIFFHRKLQTQQNPNSNRWSRIKLNDHLTTTTTALWLNGSYIAQVQ